MKTKARSVLNSDARINIRRLRASEDSCHISIKTSKLYVLLMREPANTAASHSLPLLRAKREATYAYAFVDVAIASSGDMLA